jgi:hypothetical protein
MTPIERRLFRTGALLAGVGAVAAWLIFGGIAGISFGAGGALGGISLGWLSHTVNAIVFSDRRGSTSRIIAGYLLRLSLIPLCLYVMIRFLFMGVVAAVAGFAAFNCSIFIEGIREALQGSQRKDGRAE